MGGPSSHESLAKSSLWLRFEALVLLPSRGEHPLLSPRDQPFFVWPTCAATLCIHESRRSSHIARHSRSDPSDSERPLFDALLSFRWVRAVFRQSMGT